MSIDRRLRRLERDHSPGTAIPWHLPFVFWSDEALEVVSNMTDAEVDALGIPEHWLAAREGEVDPQ